METQTQHSFSTKFTTQFGYDAFFESIKAFRAKSSKTGLLASEHIIYNQLRDLPLNRGFTPISNTIKLLNGRDPNGGYNLALSQSKFMLRNYNKDLENNFKLTKEMQILFII